MNKVEKLVLLVLVPLPQVLLQLKIAGIVGVDNWVDRNQCIDLITLLEVLVDQVTLSADTGVGVGTGADDRNKATKVENYAAVSSMTSLRVLPIDASNNDDDKMMTKIREIKWIQWCCCSKSRNDFC